MDVQLGVEVSIFAPVCAYLVSLGITVESKAQVEVAFSGGGGQLTQCPSEKMTHVLTTSWYCVDNLFNMMPHYCQVNVEWTVIVD